MKTNKLMAVALAGCLALAGLNGAVLAQEKAPAKPAAAKTMKITVKGKIVKDASMGGYYIQGEKPPEVFRIVNQNPAVLGKYAKTGESVTMETHSAMGDNLVIDSINGKTYTEAEKK